MRPGTPAVVVPCAGGESIRLVVNPRAGRGRAARFLDALAEWARGAGVEVRVPGSPTAVADEARRAADDGCRRLVVAGGDGTVHWAVQGLAGSPCALAVVPCGSGNDVAGALGVPHDPRAAFELALSGEERAIDLGRGAGRWFVTVAGVGIDGAVVERVERGYGPLRGRAVYPAAVLHTLFAFRPPGLRIEHDGGRVEGRLVLAAAGNFARFGGGMRVAPDALPDDGLFDLVTIDALAALRLALLFPQIYSGRHVTHPCVRVFRTSRVAIASDREMRLQADGEILGRVGEEPVDLAIVPGALRVVTGS